MEVWHRDLVPSIRRRDWDAAPIKMWRVSLTNLILALCWRFLWIFGREAFQGSLHRGKEIIVKSSLVAGYPASSSEDLLQTGWRLKSSCHHLEVFICNLSSVETCIVLHIHCQSTAFLFREIEPFWDLLKEKHQAANFALKTDHEAKEFTNQTSRPPHESCPSWSCPSESTGFASCSNSHLSRCEELPSLEVSDVNMGSFSANPWGGPDHLIESIILKRSADVSKALSPAKGRMRPYEHNYTVLICINVLRVSSELPQRLSFSETSCGAGTQRSLSRGRTRAYGWVLRQLNKTHCCCSFEEILVMEYQSPSDAVCMLTLESLMFWYHCSTWEKRIEFMVWIWRTHSHPTFIFHFYVLIPERRVTSTFHEWRHGQFVSICWCWLSTPSNMFRFASVFLHSNPAFQAQSLTKRWQQIWDDRHLGSMKCIFSIAPFSGTDALWPMASLCVLCVEIYSNLWQINLLWMRYPCWRKTNWYSSLKCEFAFPKRLSNSEYSWLQLLYLHWPHCAEKRPVPTQKQRKRTQSECHPGSVTPRNPISIISLDLDL